MSSAALFAAVLAGAIPVLVLLGHGIHREMSAVVRLDRRLDTLRVRAGACRTGTVRRDARPKPRARGVRSAALLISSVLSMLLPIGASERARLARMLRAVGFAQRDALLVFLNVKLALSVAGAAFAAQQAGAHAVLGGGPAVLVGACVSGFVVGGVAPEYLLRFRVGRRAAELSRVLPDAFDLMVMCLEAGLTFGRSLATVADEIRPLDRGLAAELSQLEAELRLGSDTREVLQSFADRTDVEGLRTMALTLMQSERYGTPLGRAMSNIATNERTVRAAKVEARIQRLPVLMTLPMLLLVMPGTVLLVVGPAFLSAMRALRGIAEPMAGG